MSAAASRHLPPPSSLCSSLSSLPYPSRGNVGSARLLPPMVPSFSRLRVLVQQSKTRGRAAWSWNAVGVVVVMGQGLEGGVRSGRSSASSVSSGCGGCLWEGGGAALGIQRERWRCKQSECCDRRRYGFGVLCLAVGCERGWARNACRAFCEVSEPPASQRVVGFTGEALVT